MALRECKGEPTGNTRVQMGPQRLSSCTLQATQANRPLENSSLQFGTQQGVFPDTDGFENWEGLWDFLERGEGRSSGNFSRPVSVSGASSTQGPAPRPFSLLPPLPHAAPPPSYPVSRPPRPFHPRGSKGG